MPKLLSACLAVAAIASTLSLSADGNGTQAAPCLVTTDRGAVQGRDFATSCAFLGVPYAAPTGVPTDGSHRSPVHPGRLPWSTPPPRPCAHRSSSRQGLRPASKTACS